MLKVERLQACAIWTISRPEAKNALNIETMDMLLLATEAAEKDPDLRAIVLTATGDTFVSGGDLRELREATTAADAERFSQAGSDLCRKLESLSIPVICALPGPALGGGAELALACDLRICDMRARFSFKQVRLGVTTAWGSIARLVAVVGRGTAARLLYTGHEMKATEAKLCGLADEVVADGSCAEVAIAWALDIAQGSATAIASMKALLRTACAPSAELAAEERRRFIETWTSPDHVEAMSAYFARRPPNFTGRPGQ